MFDKIPSLVPVDNLYKFLALSGLLLFFFCFFYPDWRAYGIERSRAELAGKLRILIADQYHRGNVYKIEAQFLRKDNEQQRRDSIRLLTSPKKLYITDLTDEELARYFKNKSIRDAYEFILNHKSDFGRHERRVVRIRDDLQEEEDEYKIALKEAEIKNLEDRLKFEDDRIAAIQRLGIIGETISALISILGFILWYVKHQSINDKILKKQLDTMQ